MFSFFVWLQSFSEFYFSFPKRYLFRLKLKRVYYLSSCHVSLRYDPPQSCYMPALHWLRLEPPTAPHRLLLRKWASYSAWTCLFIAKLWKCTDVNVLILNYRSIFYISSVTIFSLHTYRMPSCSLKHQELWWLWQCRVPLTYREQLWTMWAHCVRTKCLRVSPHHNFLIFSSLPFSLLHMTLTLCCRLRYLHVVYNTCKFC